MISWFFLALVSAILFGVQSFLYKTSIEKKCNKLIVMFSFMVTVMILAAIVFFVQGFKLENILLVLILAFIIGISYFLKTIGQLKALDYLPTSKVFPITSMNVIVSVILAIILFQETLTIIKIIGIIIMILAAILMHQDTKKKKNYSHQNIGFIIALLVIIPASAMGIINKYAAISTDIFLFTAIYYFFAASFSLASYKATDSKTEGDIRTSIKLGVLIGFINFVGFISLLVALKTGPLSIISPLSGITTVVAVLLSKIVHKEELTKYQFLLAILAVVALVLLKI